LVLFQQPRHDAGVQTIQTNDDDLLDDFNLPVESMTTGISRRGDPMPDFP